jgi:riboflavin biosynthesis pyrimidine reductase
MKLTQLLPEPVEEFVLDDRWRETLSNLYQPPKPQWLRINLIMTVNGNAAGIDDTSNSLTNTTDRRILGTIRRHSDIVLVGASSVRTEGYVLPKSAPLAIVTASGNLRGHRLPSEVEAGRVVVLCPPDAVETLQQSLGSTAMMVITLPGPRLDPAAMIAALRQRGYNSIVCEGGPTLAAQLLDADLVDELCLSTSPSVSEVNVPALQGLSRSTPLRLTQLLVDPESVLYARWAVQNGLAM